MALGEGCARCFEDCSEVSLAEGVVLEGVGGGGRDVGALGLEEVEEGVRVLLAGASGVIALDGAPEGDLEALDGVKDGGGDVTFASGRYASRMPIVGVHDDLQVLVAVRVWGVMVPVVSMEMYSSGRRSKEVLVGNEARLTFPMMQGMQSVTFLGS
eukprot:Plantae.Rhodophyta-Palmaria_palmata.ctg25280.p2 GENE.Plantae.Rhodophyta-Palmaria_palmata.ctg25280~~Plantae.Rhodophyta-Palmaria_palmata.ctg25280.p2  ORF type:complete len:156 (-),score=30.16 Plantae.Rhodophyta-Palmaria_palmata.ctg25280:63-530(-)